MCRHMCTDHAWTPAETNTTIAHRGLKTVISNQKKKSHSHSLSWTNKALQENTSIEAQGIILFFSIHGNIFPLTSPLACSLSRALDTHSAQTAPKTTVCSAFHSFETTYHLLDPVKSFPMETEGLFKQDLVFHCPLIWEWSKVWQICQRLLNVVLVPKQHPKSLEIIQIPKWQL